MFILFKYIFIYFFKYFNIFYSQNGVGTNCSLKESLDTSDLANSMSPNRDVQLATNGLTMPQSPKPLVPEICNKIGHKFSNLFPMLGYCDQCNERVFVGMLHIISNYYSIYIDFILYLN